MACADGTDMRLSEYRNGVEQMAETREYYRSESEAEIYLKANGFRYDPKSNGTRYPWTFGLVDADIRFNSVGYWIDYRA